MHASYDNMRFASFASRRGFRRIDLSWKPFRHSLATHDNCRFLRSHHHPNTCRRVYRRRCKPPSQSMFDTEATRDGSGLGSRRWSDSLQASRYDCGSAGRSFDHGQSTAITIHPCCSHDHLETIQTSPWKTFAATFASLI